MFIIAARNHWKERGIGIRDVLHDEVTWLVPEGRRVAIVSERSR